VAGPDAPGLHATTTSDTLLEELLYSFADVFAEPQGCHHSEVVTTASSSF
jgi:hypothetical protein